MEKMLKNVITKTIDMCYYNLGGQYENILAKNTELAKEYNKLSDESNELEMQVKRLLPNEYEELVEKLVNAILRADAAEKQMYFKEGVILGATDLSYLGELGARLQLI